MNAALKTLSWNSTILPTIATTPQYSEVQTLKYVHEYVIEM